MDAKTKRAIKQLGFFRKQGKQKAELRLAAEAWKNDYEILFSTILSARTRDEKTIPVAEALFAKYPNPKKLAQAKLKDIEKAIKPINFYKTKSRNISNCAKTIIEKHKGKIPHDFDALITLPGVGRKTANVFLAEIGHDSIGVDTHVSYISQKMGWAKSSKPEKIENDLKNLFPKKYWKKLNSTLVRFGKTHTSKKQKDTLIGEIKRIR